MNIQQTQACAHHQGVRFADKVSLFAGSKLNRCDQCAAGGDDTEIRGAGKVAVCCNQACSLVNQAYCLENHIIIIRICFADYNVIGINIIHCDAGIIKRIDKTGAADNVGTAAGGLRMDKFGSGESTGIEMTFVNLQSQT